MSKGLFASLYTSGRPFALIDTRERREHVDGHWFGSVNIPLSVLSAEIARMVPDRRFPVYLLNWHNVASQAAADRLAQLGYENVTRCQTDLPDRFSHGFVRGEFVWSKAFGEVVAHAAGLPEVTPADYVGDYRDALLIDVRPTAEYRQFTLPGSQNLPNSQLLANVRKLRATGQMVLLHCAGRTRSIIGACTLKAAGYDGKFAIFKGGTQAWQLDGHDREHSADRLFATKTSETAPVHDFLRKWGISYDRIGKDDLQTFVAEHRQDHLFDVSEDSAMGYFVDHGITRISGTNLIQQTDRSIARYHVPVILFDHGSGSRAAFTAYWLRSMGFSVRVVLVSEKLSKLESSAVANQNGDVSHELFSAEKLVAYCETKGVAFDFRSSDAYQQGHVMGSIWQNIGSMLSTDNSSPTGSEPLVVIGDSIAHGREIADLLIKQGWNVAGIFGWDEAAIGSLPVQSGILEAPIDKSAFFPGRHHGNMQDSRDYLAWEEELPDQVDQEILQLWTRLLNLTSNT